MEVLPVCNKQSAAHAEMRVRASAHSELFATEAQERGMSRSASMKPQEEEAYDELVVIKMCARELADVCVHAVLHAQHLGRPARKL